VIGSAEYAISHLRTKLLIVTGHTKCGAVTAALSVVEKYVTKAG
jgi:carbonic anhydrase